MVFRREAITERLVRLEEVISDLSNLALLDRSVLQASRFEMLAAERGLQVGAEIVFDVGNHILSAFFGAKSETYQAIVSRLADRGVISQDLRERFAGLGGFRNILVHGYLDIDSERVLDFLEKAPKDFTDFAREVRAWLEKTHL